MDAERESSQMSVRRDSFTQSEFSLLKLYFGHDRDSSLSDMIQTTLMLIYNDRATGHAEHKTHAPSCSV